MWIYHFFIKITLLYIYIYILIFSNIWGVPLGSQRGSATARVIDLHLYMNRAQLFLHEYSMFRRSWIRRGDHYWRSCCKINFKNFCHQKIQKHWSPPYLISAPLCQTYEQVLGPSKCDQYVATSVHDYSFEKYPGHNMILNKFFFFFFFFWANLDFYPFQSRFNVTISVIWPIKFTISIFEI